MFPESNLLQNQFWRRTEKTELIRNAEQPGSLSDRRFDQLRFAKAANDRRPL